MSKFTNKHDDILRYLQAVEMLSPQDLAMCKGIAARELGFSRKQLEPVLHGFKGRNPMSVADAKLFISSVEEVVETTGGIE